MKKSQFRGLLLEDAISKLLEVNGYHLITQLEQSIDDLEQLHNGLNVIGRGGSHQFDSLGQFKWTPPFTYPIRLFVEAKFRKGTAGIDLVRKGVGILVDLNHNYTTVNVDNHTLSLPRYDYHYAIFSTSGFSINAIKMAIAHKIHLIDLSGDEYSFLVNSIKQFADNIFNYLGKPEDMSPFDAKIIRKTFRKIIGLSLGKFEEEYEYNQYVQRGLINSRISYKELFIVIKNSGKEVQMEVSHIESIYLATTKTPFLIALTPDNNNAFKKSLSNNPRQEASIIWTEENAEWKIIPRNDDYSLSFTLPLVIAKYIFDDNKNDIAGIALNTKETMFSEFTLIADLEESGYPIICSLFFNSELTKEYLNR